MVRLCLLLVVAVLAACNVPPPPDPNDPRDVGMVDPEVLQRSLRSASENLNERRARGEIDENRARQLMQEYAYMLTEHIRLEEVPEEEAWRYAEIFRTARRWREARELLEVAVRHAPNEDRRVNDTLRLAEAQAHLGEVPRALELARSVFDAPPHEKAPILPAVLYEITPAAEGKGHDVELARLVADAAEQHRQVIVDPETEAGSAFLMARPHHVRNAYRKAADLYRGAGREDLGQQALERLRQIEREQVSV